MTDKVELKSCHEVIDTVDVANIESIFYGKPTDPDILTVLMTGGKRLYCDEVCPMQEEPVSGELEQAAITAADEDMQGRQIMEESNENRQLYSRIFRRGFKAGAKWQEDKDKQTLNEEGVVVL